MIPILKIEVFEVAGKFQIYQESTGDTFKVIEALIDSLNTTHNFEKEKRANHE